MRAVAILLLVRCVCLGSEISGIWRLKNATPRASTVPLAIQIEQTEDQLQVLKIMAGPHGQYLEHFTLSGAAVRSTPAGAEITISGETWTIGARGELTLRRGRVHFVLKPAQGVVE
jgi:hypothetical protein